MPRRRLHGVTQQRRKKPRTRLLKRAESVVRPQATQQPAPFERSPQVERDDLEFLEAMRELQVERGPWRGESHARRQSVEHVQFLAEAGEATLFLRGMAHQGVAPLAGRSGGPATQPPAADAPAPQASATPTQPAPAPPAPTAAERPEPHTGHTEPLAAPTAPQRTADHDGAPDEGTSPGAQAEPAPPERTDFAPDEGGDALMAALLQEDEFAPELKFAGATAPTRRPPARRAREDDGREPDRELDLHGKTQEEAIRMVQSFLLVSQRERLRHVLIITGRGHNSGSGGPVLKDAVYRWLELNGKRFARTFARAPGRLGGDGAIWITLR